MSQNRSFYVPMYLPFLSFYCDTPSYLLHESSMYMDIRQASGIHISEPTRPRTGAGILSHGLVNGGPWTKVSLLLRVISYHIIVFISSLPSLISSDHARYS